MRTPKKELRNTGVSNIEADVLKLMGWFWGLGRSFQDLEDVIFKSVQSSARQARA